MDQEQKCTFFTFLVPAEYKYAAFYETIYQAIHGCTNLLRLIITAGKYFQKSSKDVKTCRLWGLRVWKHKHTASHIGNYCHIQDQRRSQSYCRSKNFNCIFTQRLKYLITQCVCRSQIFPHDTVKQLNFTTNSIQQIWQGAQIRKYAYKLLILRWAVTEKLPVYEIKCLLK